MSKSPALRVGIWPGRSGTTGNPFVDHFAIELNSAGAMVVNIENIAIVDPVTIDILHVHWPEQVFWVGGGSRAVGLRLLATLKHLRLLKKKGVIIVWMVHNLEPHDMSWKRRLLWSIYRRQLCLLVDGFMALSPATIDIVRQNLPGLRSKPAKFVWMPAYPYVEPDPQGATIRNQLGVGERSRLYCFLGLLRPYKGIEGLFRAFCELPDSGDRLVIAGNPVDRDYTRALTNLIRSDLRVKLIDRHLLETEFSGYLAAADIVVLPFRKYLHSSSMLHALCGHRPVVTPDTPFARALCREVGKGWVNIYRQPLRGNFLRDCEIPAAPPKLEVFSNHSMGKETIAFYNSLHLEPN